MLHLFARYWEMQPLFLAAAWPMNVEWKIRPYFGVLSLVFRALETWSLCWAQGITQTQGLAIRVLTIFKCYCGFKEALHSQVLDFD